MGMIVFCSVLYGAVVVYVFRMYAEEAVPTWTANDVSGKEMLRIVIKETAEPIVNEVVENAQNEKEEEEKQPLLLERPFSAV